MAPLGHATKKAKVYKAVRAWIQYRKWAEKKYDMYCMINDICVYCNDPLDSKVYCQSCEPELHDRYYMREVIRTHVIPYQKDKVEDGSDLTIWGCVGHQDRVVDASMLKYTRKGYGW